jgi:hypothetical protein
MWNILNRQAVDSPWSDPAKKGSQMFTLVAALMFAGAFAAAAFAIYATVAPSLTKIETALWGDAPYSVPALPPRRISTLRVTFTPVAGPARYLRAAA